MVSYETLKGLLEDMGIAYIEDPFLVRGLDYYTRTAFELESDDLGAQSALAGGGRYDLLALEIGSKNPVPAVGFAAGMERLLLAVAEAGNAIPTEPTPDVYLVSLGEEALYWALPEAMRLRAGGLRVALDLKGRSLKAQMREANRLGVRYTVIVGSDELRNRKVTVKNMTTSDQEEVVLDDLEAYLKQQAAAHA
jgi:histidyl-tRNA synthetase